jgi:hypothetical protein
MDLPAIMTSGIIQIQALRRTVIDKWRSAGATLPEKKPPGIVQTSSFGENEDTQEYAR